MVTNGDYDTMVHIICYLTSHPLIRLLLVSVSPFDSITTSLYAGVMMERSLVCKITSPYFLQVYTSTRSLKRIISNLSFSTAFHSQLINWFFSNAV